MNRLAERIRALTGKDTDAPGIVLEEDETGYQRITVWDTTRHGPKPTEAQLNAANPVEGKRQMAGSKLLKETDSALQRLDVPAIVAFAIVDKLRQNKQLDSLERASYDRLNAEYARLRSQLAAIQTATDAELDQYLRSQR